jgi:hypothetical protein
MEVLPSTLEQVYEDIVNSVGYKTTVGPTDKQKVARRRAGEKTALPSARLARAAWRVAALLSPLVPPPPPPPPAKVAPRTYNAALPNLEPSARFCTTGLSRNGNGRLFDSFSEYDDDGRSLGGRTEDTQVSGLRPANEMNGLGSCDPYLNFPPWPLDSYKR